MKDPFAFGTLVGRDSEEKPFKKEENRRDVKQRNPFSSGGIPVETALADKLLDGINTLDFDPEYFAGALITGTLGQQERILDIFLDWVHRWAAAYDEGLVSPENGRVFNLAAQCKRIDEFMEAFLTGTED